MKSERLTKGPQRRKIEPLERRRPRGEGGTDVCTAPRERHRSIGGGAPEKNTQIAGGPILSPTNTPNDSSDDPPPTATGSNPDVAPVCGLESATGAVVLTGPVSASRFG